MRLYYIFICLLLILGCKNSEEKNKVPISEEQCIKTILEQDSILGNIRNHATETLSLNTTITNYTDSLKDLDFNYCPDDFSNAFQTHIDAWIAMKTVTDNYSNLRGEMHDVFDQIELSKDSVAFKTKLKAIWDTWKTIEERQQ
ncbi:hypothetical protein [uncultured Psychroserpens sp.]|uniref:hypothetical protein n=1 Tax=uncultured Psychroserpens sp. TaxID=255436 RepID=UPI0026160C34|nr:hypothetical protein [uncultured Psychroserpens sp.]